MVKPDSNVDQPQVDERTVYMVQGVLWLVVSGLACLMSEFKKPIMNWAKQNWKLVATSGSVVVVSIGASNPVALQIALKNNGFPGAVTAVIMNICGAAEGLVTFLIKSGSLAAFGLKSGASRFGGPQSSVLAVVVAAVLVLSQMQVVGTVGAVLASAFRSCRNRFQAEERKQVGQEERPDAAMGRTIVSNKLLWLPLLLVLLPFLVPVALQGWLLRSALSWDSWAGAKIVLSYSTDKAAILEDGSEDGHTSLILAASKGHTEVVKVLGAAGALEAIDKDGRTPLIKAAVEGRTEVVKVL
eukprot:CAMPEP_0175131586 /NCGR_PEP_ID=MMETSP0087-20121206/6625_1 /TAXON_ID=136419 /ORGANISM="Unknown Unknown, Strain D1" /LENGTH=298 /DNA_ID=CAMNT_0016413893 /DNA_START=32 /DNA_END=925 /DNA_ORIENTATION=+